MRRGSNLILTAAAVLLLASSGSAYADSTYDITTISDANNNGTLSGSLTGAGDNLTSFDVTASNGGVTYVFDSSVASSLGYFTTGTGISTSPGGPSANLIFLGDSAGDSFSLLVSGDFSSGLTALQIDQAVYSNGSPAGEASGAYVDTSLESTGAQDDVSLTLQTSGAPTPEPSTFLLMGTGLAGLCTTLRRRLPSA